MSAKQKSVKVHHEQANYLVLCAIAISLISVLGIALPPNDAKPMPTSAIFAVVNILIWAMAIWYKIDANHYETMSLIKEKFQ